jgi:hypothetical protein
MPSVAGRATAAAWKRIPWRTVWAISVWLAEKGRERVRENLSAEEQSEFWSLIKKSKGRPGNLRDRDRTRMKAIVGKAVRGT